MRRLEQVDLASYIRDVPDFPQPGVVFKDLTPLWADQRAFRTAVDGLSDPFTGEVDIVAGIEARGFVLAAAVAYHLGVGFVPLRKAGKLPSKKERLDYDLEYGSDALEAHVDAVLPGARVLLVDDVLATGGTARAGAELVERIGGKPVALAFLVELAFLGGAGRLEGREVLSLVRYD